MLDEPLPPPPPTHGPTPPALMHRALEALKDNIEAFTIALVMALVIKHYCVEAFKIPTGSMEPTLWGEQAHGVGDRILVDKNAYLVKDPQRWDVPVFRFPLNKSKHFIKRVASPGGEFLKIVRGDLWTRTTRDEPWRIATKPRRVRNELYRPVFPPQQRGEAGYDSADAYWELDGSWGLLDYDRLRFAGGASARARILRRIGETSGDSYEGLAAGGRLVHDVRIRLRLVPERGADVTIRWETAEDRDAELHLAASGSSEGSWVGARRPGRSLREPLDLGLEVGKPMDVEFECVDGEVHLQLQGKPVARFDLKPSIEDFRAFQDFTQSFEIHAVGGAVEVERIRLDRDVEYEDDGMYAIEEGDDGVWVPEGHLFMLGDNTGSSHDSRKWELITITLTSGAPIVYYYDSKDPPVTDHVAGTTTVTDKDGIRRTWKHDDVEDRDTHREPFVPRSLVVGRAFFIFWPLTPHFPGRLRFIH